MSEGDVSTLDSTEISSPRDAANRILNAHKAGKIVTLFCQCEAEYLGRAGGYLPVGNRTVHIKPDGNFLVIGSTKHKPRNWQPTGANLTVRTEEGNLILQSTRDSPEEELVVICDAIYSLSIFDAGDDPEVTLNGTEEDMHQRILDNPEIIGDEFTPLEHEKSVEFGAIDIFGENADDSPVVVEVKRRRAQLKNVDQLKRYLSLFENDDPDGVLVAPSCSSSVKQALSEHKLRFVEMQPRVESD